MKNDERSIFLGWHKLFHVIDDNPDCIINFDITYNMVIIFLLHSQSVVQQQFQIR
jgi:hypothetical protein